MNELLRIALELATAGVPPLPLRAGKVPFGNCRTCAKGACGGRPNMKSAGPCQCPAVCHAWAAATADARVLTSPAWAPAWREAQAVAYHPGGAGLTVVDLDDDAAVSWARQTLPHTRTVPTTRGEHWIYLGTMQSANAVLPGVDVKSLMQYARWLGPGTGTMQPLPPAVRALVVREETTPARGRLVSSSPGRAVWDAAVATGCRHTERYVRTGLDRGVAMVLSRTESGAGSQAFGVAQFLARQHAQCPGPCGLEAIGEQIIAAAVSVGVPETYAERAVTNGMAATPTGPRTAVGAKDAARQGVRKALGSHPHSTEGGIHA
ncbi:DNA primase [Streptomyces mirabilis]|uniref:DNA primase n=1 Tax=Streptomyces mirabilis TaxID=68239 RepID=UPI00332633E4